LTIATLIQSLLCLSVNDDLYFDFSTFIVENPDSLEKEEPKQAFIFNDTRFKIGRCADGTKFQKTVSFSLVFNGKSVYKLIISSCGSLTVSLNISILTYISPLKRISNERQ